ncbi:MAG: methylcobalamin:coenzyme M methyltransferase [Candidatus Hydrogenedentes bacterium ADurb.Bin170]|nr:MAG: methylcobalamin:coenzyme M methyltransferase [Candidatus Hydrogenedentes bacterium ADurb.Bin170]
MNSRERVLAALNFEAFDRTPRDLGGMPSTGISCFAYPALVQALGLPPRRPRVYDTGQMLALPDTDVLDALGCDVVTLQPDVTNAFPQPELWHPYHFNNRLDAEVLDLSPFSALPDGSVRQTPPGSVMPPHAYVFDVEHAGHALVLSGDIPRPDLDEIRASLKKRRWSRERKKQLLETAKRVRDTSDRAVLFNGLQPGMGITNFTGLALFPMLCLTEPEFVEELHGMLLAFTLEALEDWLPELGHCIDIYMCSADDWGTQSALIASPQIYRTLFKPFYKKMNDAIHQLAPGVKTFLHSCGAIYDLMDDIAESGFDILNPVQWTAGGHSVQEWKDKARHRIALWGGGVNTQHTLPRGTVQEVEEEVRRTVSCLQEDSGYVFCAIHNILAEIDPEKIIAMYRAAGDMAPTRQ